LSIPNDFEIPVSSFGRYGGHAAIHLQYNSNALSPTFRAGEDTSKNNIAYLQGMIILLDAATIEDLVL
jgi:hypothetical protein